MAVKDKNVLMTDSGTGYVIPAQPNLKNYAKNYNSTPSNAYAGSSVLAPDMDRAMRQAKVNLGYLPKQPSGMPSSDYNKMLDMIERQNANKAGNGKIGVGALSGALMGAVQGKSGVENGTTGSGGSTGGSGGGNSSAQNYYNNSLQALQDAYAQKLASLQSNLDSTRSVLKNDYDLSKNNLAADAERALQEAYVNKMMNERSLEQQLNAQGLRGGATESAVASLLNNYGNSRNDINTAYSSNLAQLENAYLNNLAIAQQSYNDAVAKAASDNANYRLELERALYKSMFG